MKENLLNNKIVGGEHTEIALEIYMKETEGVLIMLQISYAQESCNFLLAHPLSSVFYFFQIHELK